MDPTKYLSGIIQGSQAHRVGSYLSKCNVH